MQPLNYLRQATEEMRRIWIPGMKDRFPEDVMVCEQVIAEATKAPKFMLPKGGRIFNDRLRGLPDELRLPYPEILIEYEASDAKDGLVEKMFGAEHSASAPKRIVLAQEVEGWIHVHSLIQLRLPERSVWIMQPYIAAITRSDNLTPETNLPQGVDAKSAIPGLAIVTIPTGRIAPTQIGANWQENAYADLMDECNSVLELVEALSCSNVTHEPLPARKPNKSAIKRGALPFDEYRVLVINSHGASNGRQEPVGSHRSPREHLRRGHIRRLQDGRKVWVNATVVNAGTTGKVTTIYDTRKAA